MSGIAVYDMASIPAWSQASSSEDISEKLHTGAGAWKRETGVRINSDPVVMNGIRSNSDDLSHVGSIQSNSQNSLNDSDHIVSVHNNPFFKTYGIRTHRPDSRGDEPTGREGVTLRSANRDDVFDEEPGEYRPGSGFVSKLTGRFASLTTREENIYRPKRTSSLENLLDDHSKRESSRDDVQRRSQAGISTSLSKSVENVNSYGKSLVPLKVPTSSYRSSYDTNERRSYRSSREISDVPPLSRDDIILIEKEPMEKPEPKPTTTLSPSTGKFTGPQVISLKEDVGNTDELPKPNTVLSVRSMFEKSSSAPPLPIYTTATGPNVISPTSNLKTPQFSQKAVSKVSPSVSSESAQNNVSNHSEEKPKKRMAPKPPVQTHQIPEQKTTLPQAKPRSKPSPVIAVAPFVNDAKSTEQELEITSKLNSVKKSKEEVGGIWSEESVSKVFDSSAIIKPPEKQSRIQSKYSGSAKVESTSTVSKTVPKEEPKPEKKYEKPYSNGMTNGSTKHKNTKPEPSFNSSKKTIDSSTTKPVPAPLFIPSTSSYTSSSSSFTSPESSNSKPDVSFSPELSRFENIPYDSKLEQIFPSAKPSTDDIHLDISSDIPPVEILPEGGGPVRARVISERLKKDGNKTGHHQSSVVNSASQEDNTQKFALNSVKKRRINSEENEKKDTTNPEIVNFRKNLKSVSDSKSSKVSQVFDTSQIVRVPKLDLRSINDERQNGYYQEGYKPTEIKPCTIIFIGAEVKLGRNMLEKNRPKKGKITFNDNHNQLFEYPSEEVLLEDYLAQNPNEPAEILILEDMLGSAMTESSDDVDEEPQTPRGGGSMSDDTLKSNTALTHSGGLSSYRSKFQPEYTFGSSMDEPEEPKPTPPPEEEEESSQIVPADEEITWSSETNADLLF